MELFDDDNDALFGSDDDDDEEDDDDDDEDYHEEGEVANHAVDNGDEGEEDNDVMNDEEVAAPPAVGGGQPAPVPVILGYIPPEGTDYVQPRQAPARCTWHGRLNAFIRDDPTDTRRNGPGPSGYVWVPEINGFRRTEQQTVSDEANIANRAANGRNGAPGRNLPFYGLDVPNASLIELSGYCGGCGHHAPLAWFNWLVNCFTGLCDHDGSAFAIGQERGDRRRLIHFQWMLRLVTSLDKIERLRRHIRDHLNIPAGGNMKCKIQIKPFRNQSWSYMLGYCQKDSNETHYRFAKFGVTDQEAEQGRQDYLAVVPHVAYVNDVNWVHLMMIP